MKIAVITDTHANLPALRAALDAIAREGVDATYHTGDVVALGPHPLECLELLLATPRLHFVMGNHDSWLAGAVPRPNFPADYAPHEDWTLAAVPAALRAEVSRWPWSLTHELGGRKVRFVHYGFADATGTSFPKPLKAPDLATYETMFGAHPADLTFYGHDHLASDLTGRARYVNPGALGCSPTAEARYAVATLQAGRVEVQLRSVPYDDRDFLAAWQARRMPWSESAQRIFHGDRFRSAPPSQLAP